MIFRLLLALSLLGLAAAAPAAPKSAGPAPAGSRAPACPFGASPAEMRAEAYCTAQLALRSTIARSLGMLEARMSAGNSAFAADLRQAQDLRSQHEALAAAEREARGQAGDA